MAVSNLARQIPNIAVAFKDRESRSLSENPVADNAYSWGLANPLSPFRIRSLLL